MSRSTTPFDTFVCPHCAHPIFNAVRRTPSCVHRETSSINPNSAGYLSPLIVEEPRQAEAVTLYNPHFNHDGGGVPATTTIEYPRHHQGQLQQQQPLLEEIRPIASAPEQNSINPYSYSDSRPGNFYDSVYSTYNTPPYHHRPMETETENGAPKAAVGEGPAIEPTSSAEGTVAQHDDVEQQQQTAEPAKKHPREGWPAWKWTSLQAGFCLGCILMGYDVSNVANIQAPVYEAFGHVELLPWVAIGYSALNVCMVPLVRKMLVIGNLRNQLVAYELLFIIGAAVAGSAHNMSTLIAGRVITGIGGAGVYQVAVVMNVILCTPLELPRTQGLMGMTWALGLVLGPLIGGAFAENHHATWRWALYINIPALAVMILVNFAATPPIHLAPNLPTTTALLSIDWAGFVLHAAGFVLICSALIYSGSTWPWSSSSAIVAWVFVGVIYLAYVLQQRFSLLTTRDRRIFPGDLFRNRGVALIVLSVMVAGCGYGVTLYYTPLFFAFTRGFSPVGAAVRLLPYIGTFVFFTMLSGILVPIIGIAPPFYIVGGALVMIGSGLQTTLKPSTSEANVMGRDALIGAGVGCLWQTGVGFVTHMVAPERKLDVSGLYIVMQLGGTSLMLAVAGSIFQNVGFQFLSESIGGLGFSEGDLRQALAGVDSKVWSSADEQTMALAVDAVTRVIARINYLILAAGALAFLCGCCMKWEKLDFGRAKKKKAEAEAEEAEKTAVTAS